VQAPPEIEAPPTVPVTRGDVRQTVTAPGRLIDARIVTLSFDAAGKLAEINVRPGDAVKAGDTIARLETAALELQLAQAEQAYVIQQAIYSDTVQPDPNAIAAAEVSLASATANYQAAQQHYDTSDDQIALSCSNVETAREAYLRARDAYEAVPDDHRGWYYERKQQAAAALAFTKNAYDAAIANCDLATQSVNDGNVRSAWAQVVAARNRLDELVAPAQTILLKAQVDLENARLAVEKAKRDLAAAALTAPFDGVVLEVLGNTGDAFTSGTPIVLLSDPSAVEVEATVIEEDIPLVERDQSVDLFFDAAPEALVSGRVARIVPQRIAGDRPLYPIYIELDHLPQGLAPGMTVDASIVIDSHEDVLRLPRAVVRARSDNSAIVSVWLGDHAEERSVQVGLRGDQYVEILNGLREGEQVVSE
jgi:HlyD family secretion protein